MKTYTPKKGDQIIAGKNYKGELFGVNIIEVMKVTKKYVEWYCSVDHKAEKGKFIRMALKTINLGAELKRSKRSSNGN